MFNHMSKVLFVSATIIGATTNSHASVLNEKEIKQLVNGKKIFLTIPFGGEFPLKYNTTGVVRGDGTGTGLGKYLAPKDTGKWWIAEGQLCQKWSEWYKGKTTCFIISDKNGKKFRWKRDDGRSGKGRVE